MSSTKPIAGAPLAQSERIIILDALRRIDIIGILLMNIPGFWLPGSRHWTLPFTKKQA